MIINIIIIRTLITVTASNNRRDLIRNMQHHWLHVCVGVGVCVCVGGCVLVHFLAVLMDDSRVLARSTAPSSSSSNQDTSRAVYCTNLQQQQ